MLGEKGIFTKYDFQVDTAYNSTMQDIKNSDEMVSVELI